MIIGIGEGIGKAIADIFTGLYEIVKSLFTDPIDFLGGIATAIFNSIDTAKM